jgi:hypothetical protein
MLITFREKSQDNQHTQLIRAMSGWPSGHVVPHASVGGVDTQAEAP